MSLLIYHPAVHSGPRVIVKGTAKIKGLRDSLAVFAPWVEGCCETNAKWSVSRNKLQVLSMALYSLDGFSFLRIVSFHLNRLVLQADCGILFSSESTQMFLPFTGNILFPIQRPIFLHPIWWPRFQSPRKVFRNVWFFGISILLFNLNKTFVDFFVLLSFECFLAFYQSVKVYTSKQHLYGKKKCNLNTQLWMC